jgi:hypothetical protein
MPMRLDPKDRTRLRKLNNDILAILDRIGRSDSEHVSVHCPEVTIAKLRQFLYPEYESELRTLLRSLRGRRV